jgi:hypothetical protein
MTTLNFTDEDLHEAVGEFLQGYFDGNPGIAEVIRGQVNRVPSPRLPNYIVITLSRADRFSTAIEDWDHSAPATELEVSHSAAITMQADFHGPRSTELALIAVTLWRSDVGCDRLTDSGFGFQPLYATDGTQMPFVNEAGQYEDRWMVLFTMQANPRVSTSYAFADRVAVTIVPPVGASS